MRPKWMHCGLPLQHTTKLVAILDMVLGTLAAALFIVYFDDIENNLIKQQKTHEQKEKTYHDHHRSKPLPPEVIWVMLIASFLQVLMGIFLFIGAMKKSKRICQIWMWTTALTFVIIITFLPRVYGLIIVTRFQKELEQEGNRVQVNGVVASQFPSANWTQNPGQAQAIVLQPPVWNTGVGLNGTFQTSYTQQQPYFLNGL